MGKIGVFGGSGFYSFLEDVKSVRVDTPFGCPSDLISSGVYKGKDIVFLSRHGNNHTIPPHMINYKANVWAFKELGVSHIIAPTAAGSLRANLKPGDFVVVDQFVDRTNGRQDTFYDGPVVTHISGATPYCACLRRMAIDVLSQSAVCGHDAGTVVVVQGPRFSTKSESEWFIKMGWDVVNMTQYPEVVLARELEMCFVNISVITDYDIGVSGVNAVAVDEMVKTFQASMMSLRSILFDMVERINLEDVCSCHDALKFSRFH